MRSTTATAPRRSRAHRHAGRSASAAARRRRRWRKGEALTARYRLTVRHGPRVAHERFDDLDEAVNAMKRQTQLIRQEGPLEEVSAIREYGPGQRVHARLELSAGGLLRRRAAGMDLMGDGALVPFAGVIRKEPLELAAGDSPFDAVRKAVA